MKPSIKRKLLLASLVLSGMFVAVGLVVYVSVTEISADTRAVFRIAQEHDQFLELQLVLAKALSPPAEYLITGDRAHRASFVNHFAAVEEGVSHLRGSTMLSAFLARAGIQLATIEDLGRRILALPSPVGSPEGMSLMAAMDGAAHDLIAQMDEVHASHKAAMAAAVAQQERAMQRSTRALVGTAMLATALSLAFSLVVSRSITGPIAALRRGTEIIGSGDLSYRLSIQGQDEVGQLAGKFNTMADRLEDAYASLEERVVERTRELAEKNRELQAYHRVHQELLARVISVQEEERRRIARGLHDETSQAIATLSVNLDFLQSTVADARLKERLAKLRAVAEGTLDRIHKVIFDLRPRVLDDLGLAPAIAGYLESHLLPLGIEATLEAHGLEGRLPPEVETASFRIIQEAITNVVKHAHARHVQVCVDFNGTVLVMFAEDDGVGFEPQEVLNAREARRGLGLLGIRERVAYLGGTVNIHSRPGGGTRLYVEVPVEVPWNGSESSSPTTMPSFERASV